MGLIQNPNNPTPLEIEQQIIALEVDFVDFNGQTKKGAIEINSAVRDDVDAFFREARRIRFPIENVVRSSDAEYGWDDDKLIEANVTSGFNYRPIKHTNKPSLHALGLAFDVNPRINPYIRFNEDGTHTTIPEGSLYDPSAAGVLTSDHPLVAFMKDLGWEWGGEWTKESGRIDYQHFQKMPK